MSEISDAIAEVERFVRGFHSRCVGATHRAYARGRALGDGRSSYQLIAAAVPPGLRTLDLGCGDGALLRDRPGWIGVDLSLDEARLARGHGPVVQARAGALPFADRGFGACVSHLAFSILPDPIGAAHEIARVLAPGGVLAIVTGGGPAPPPLGDDVAFERLLALAAPVAARYPGAVPRQGDRRTRTREGLDGLLGPAGFAPVAYASYTIDLGGGFDDVWATLDTIYELDPLAPDERAALRAALRAEVGVGPVACAMRIGLATAVRR